MEIVKTPSYWYQIFGLLLFLLVTGGVGVAVYLSSQSQDTRQQASDQGIIHFSVSPAGETYTSVSPKTVGIDVNTGASLIRIDQLDFTFATITGDIPPDLAFSLAPLPGVVKVTTTVESTTTGKAIRLRLTNPSNSYSTSNMQLTFGRLTFSPLQKGTMTVTLDPSIQTAIKGLTGEAVITLATPAVFTFAGPTPSPSPTSRPTPPPAGGPTLTVLPTATTVAQKTASIQSLVASTPTPPPTSGPAPTPSTLLALAQSTTTPIPTNEPTTAPTPTPTPQPTSEPTLPPIGGSSSSPTPLPTSGSTSQSTLLALAQATTSPVTATTAPIQTSSDTLPQSGAVENTIALLAFGIALIVLGAGLFIGL